MWEFFINNQRFSYLVMVALLGFGLFSIAAIPKESAPEVQIPVGIVSTVLPGAPSIDVESLITNEIERGLTGALQNVKKITSRSSEGVSVVTVEFNADADIDKSITDLKNKVDTLVNRLPNDAEEPFVSEVNFVDQPIITLAVAGNLTEDEFARLATALEAELEAIPGVSRVEKAGVREPEVAVVVTEAALLRYNLSITDVLNGIRSANSLFPVGQIVTDEVSYNIVLEGDLDTGFDIASVPVAVRGGQPVLVRDIADVQVRLASAQTFSRLSVASKLSVDSFTLNIFKQRGGDITELTDAVNTKISQLGAADQLLSGLTVYIVQDAGEEIKKELTQLTSSGVQTVILVVALLMLAIGWREGLIAGLAIPLSFTIGFIGLYLSGNTINFISLFALILGIGVLVDSGIVVIEGINKRMKENVEINKTEAALLTIREFSAPLISGTLTTVAMFVGLFVVSGVTGQFIASIPFTLIFILFASLLVALGFLPLIAATFMRRRTTNQLEKLQLTYSRRLEDWYRGFITKIISSRQKSRRFISLIIFGFISAIALIPFGFVQVIFFAQGDLPMIFVEVELPEGSVKEASDLAVRRIEEILYSYNDEIEAFSVTVGAANAFTGGGQGAKLANVYIALYEDRERTSTEISEALRADFATLNDIKVSVTQINNGPPTGAPIGVKLTGDDLESLYEGAEIMIRGISDIDGITNVRTSANSNSAEFVFTIDKEKAAALGLSPLLISQTLRSAVYGSEATTITSLTDDIPVMVRLNLSLNEFVDADYANYTTIDTLLGLLISTPTGETVQLSSVVTPSLRESSAAIAHEDQERVVTVSADLTGTGNVREINSLIIERLAGGNISLPEGVAYQLGGETEESTQAFQEMFLALIVGVVLMIGVLVLQFDSYRHTAYVLSILPFSLIGILYGLAITGSALSFPSILGFIALSGIVVNNSILLIDMMNQTRKREPNRDILSVVVESAVSRLRPIVLTSITTVAGMMPLLFTDEVWIPLATAIMFGLTFSVVITLILIPVIYNRWPGVVRSKF